MADAVAIISRAQFEKLAGKEPKLGVQLRVDRYDSTHAGLDTLADGGALFLVTVRPGDKLWLVQVLRVLTKDKAGWHAVSNHCATCDLTAVLAQLDLTRGVAKGKLAMSLQTPRALTTHDARLLVHAANGAHDKSTRKKVYAVTFPKWLLDHAAQAVRPADKKEKEKVSAKPAKRAKTSTLGPAKGVLAAAFAQLEEVLPVAKPAALLDVKRRGDDLRGAFTRTVQSVFAGAIDDKEARRLLREDLAPWVDGPSLATALAAAGTDLGDLVDQFAIKAMDDVACALLALALDRPADVPATCVPFVEALMAHRGKVAALLED